MAHHPLFKKPPQNGRKSVAGRTHNTFSAQSTSPHHPSLPIAHEVSERHFLNDPLERQADAMANAVMRAPESSRGTSGAGGEQRSAEQAQHLSAGQPPRAHDRIPFDAQISAARQSSGLPLSSNIRTFMEPRFGVSFEGVRIHSGDKAAALAQKVHARAFTVGHDVFFGAGEFRPQSPESRRLLAHELSHTIQQANVAPRIQRSPPEDCPVADTWFYYIPTLPKKFFDHLAEVDGPTKITPEDLDALTREEIRSLSSALQNYIDYRKCTGQAEAMYYYHEQLLNNSVGPRAQKIDDLEKAPDRLDDWIFYVFDNMAIGDVDRSILMQCAPYISRRMKQIVAGAPLPSATKTEIESVGYFTRETAKAADQMTTEEIAGKQVGGNLNQYFRDTHMTNAAVQIIRGIPNLSNAHEDWEHLGIERGGSFADLKGILRSIKEDMRAGLSLVRRIRETLMTSDAGGVVQSVMQLNDYIDELQMKPETLYAVNYERGSDAANIDYARALELRTLQEIWPETPAADE